MTGCSSVYQQAESGSQMNIVCKAPGAEREDGVVCVAVMFLDFSVCSA